MKRTHVRRRRRGGALVVGVALSIAPLASRGALAAGATPEASHTYVVRAGDTVWDIAAAESEERDPRPLVDAIVALNGLEDASVRPGQRLLVPASG